MSSLPDSEQAPSQDWKRQNGNDSGLIKFQRRVSDGIDKHPFLILTLIVGLSLALGSYWFFRHPPALDSGETGHWWPIAENLAQGRGYVFCYTNFFPFCGPTNQITAQREPVPIFIFAGIALLTNNSLPAAAAFGFLVNMAIVLAIFFLARDLLNTRLALLAAFLWAIYVPAILLLPRTSGDLLGTCGMVWGMFFFTRALRSRRSRDWLLAGGFMALGALSRSVVLISVGGLALALLPWWQLTSTLKSGISKLKEISVARLKPFMLFTLVVALTMLPWMVRNYLTFDRIVIGSTLTGYNMYRHNHILPTDDYLRYVNGTEAQTALETLFARRTDLRGNENEVQIDEVYKQEALRIEAEYPGRYILLSAYRFLPLWFDWNIQEAYGLNVGTMNYVAMLQQLFFLITAIIGSFQRRERVWPLGLSVLLVAASYMAINSRLRFIVIVMPYVILFSVIGISWLWKKLSLNLRLAK